VPSGRTTTPPEAGSASIAAWKPRVGSDASRYSLAWITTGSAGRSIRRSALPPGGTTAWSPGWLSLAITFPNPALIRTAPVPPSVSWTWLFRASSRSAAPESNSSASSPALPLASTAPNPSTRCSYPGPESRL